MSVKHPRPWDYPDCPECKSDVFVTHTANELYRCEMCNISFESYNGETSEPMHPQTKRDWGDWGGDGIEIDSASQEEIDKIHQSVHNFYIRRYGRNDKKIHLPNIGIQKTMCGIDQQYSFELRAVEPDKYPPGHKDICKNCLREWRQL